MAEFDGTVDVAPCALCLQVDELHTMLELRLLPTAGDGGLHRALCRGCVEVITVGLLHSERDGLEPRVSKLWDLVRQAIEAGRKDGEGMGEPDLEKQLRGEFESILVGEGNA